MKNLSWQVSLGLVLLSLSVFLYGIHFFIFQDAHHILLYLVGDIAFIPIEVLIVTLVIHRLLAHREKHLMLRKLNMLIGAFYSEVGTPLLGLLSEFDSDPEGIKKDLMVAGNWSERDFTVMRRRMATYGWKIDSQRSDLEGLRAFLVSKRGFLLGLLGNPNLLEHDTFTDLLWAVFHLTEELTHRADVTLLSYADYAHLSGDIERAYVLLIREWLAYTRHLSKDYPYLASLAIRLNPFDPNASVEIQDASNVTVSSN